MSMPDWRKLEDYEYTEKLNSHGWAWEFLRRDKRFIEDYAALQKDEVKDEFGNSSVFLHKTKMLFHKGKYILVPPLAKGESINGWFSKYVNAPEGMFFYTPREYLASKWGLGKIIPNPEKNACEYFETEDSEKCKKIVIFRKSAPRIIDYYWQLQEIPTQFGDNETSSSDGEAPIKIENGRVIVEFSLDEKIQPQFETLKDILEERQKKYSKTIEPQRKKLIRRLRALDAKLEHPKVKKSDIQKEIYDENENATEPMTHDNDLRYLKRFKNKSSFLTLARSKI